MAAETQGGSDETENLPRRLERARAAKARAMSNVAYIRGLHDAYPASLDVEGPCRSPAFLEHLREILPAFQDCASYLHFRQYYTVGKVRLVGANFCRRHLLCPPCAIRRAAKTLKAYLDRLRVLKAVNPALRLSLVTLTVRNGPDLAERMEHLRACVSDVLKRRKKARNGSRHKTEWAKIEALVGSYETTNRGNGWHPHAHILVLHSERLDYSAMIEEWRRLTGDSCMIHVDAARHPDDPARDFLEVFKYALKFSDLTPAQNLEAYAVLRGKRLLFSAGAFRGVEVPDDLGDDLLDDLPYLDLFYRWIAGQYHLEMREPEPEYFDAAAYWAARDRLDTIAEE